MKPARNSAGVRLNLIRTAALLIWGAVMMAPSVARAQPSASSKGVLVLYWYNKDFPWNVKFDQSFKAALQSAPAETVEYYPEYLETNRFPGERQSLFLRNYLRQKYADRAIDVVVANSDVSLDFLLKYRDDLFPRTPIVFVAARHPTKEELAAGPGLTGVININAHRKTLDLALRLHPGTEQVFVISGTLGHDKKFETLAREELQGYESRVRINYLTDYSPNELIEKTKSLPERSIVLYVWQQSQNEQGRVIESAEIFASIAGSTPVPIYGMTNQILGKGIVGGYINTSEATGTKVAEIALRIANGARAQDVPVESAPTAPMFDWRQLRRWGIGENLLPPGSVVRFKESTLWEQHKQRIIGVSALFVVQTLLIAVLLLERARRQRANYELRESEERFSKAFHSSPQPMSITSLEDGRYLDVNERFLEISGYAREEVIGRTSLELNIWESPIARAELVGPLIEGRAVRNLETKFGTKGAGFRIFLLSAEMIELGGKPRVLVASSDITERKQAEEALRESEARFRNMADNAPVMVRMADADGAATYASQSWYEFTGQTPETALGFGWVAALHPDDREVSEKTFLAANVRREAFRLEYRLRRKDGEYRWAIDSARPRFGAQGVFLGYIGSVVDITETKRAELNTQFINQLDFELSQIADADEIIRLATSRLGEYLGVTSCYVIEVNPAAGLAFVRESWDGWRIAGPSIVGEYRISDFVTPECLDEFEAGRATVVKDVMNDPRMRDFTSKYESLGVGAFISIPALNERQWEANLTVDHPQARDWRPDETQLMRDIAARLWPAYKRARAAEALRDSEERLRLALGAGRMGVWEFDATTNAVKWSREYYTIIGLQPFSVEPDYMIWEDMVHPEDLIVAMGKMSRAIEEKGEYRHEYRIIWPDGNLRWVEDRAKPVYDEGGQCLKVSGFIVDITERKQAEESLRESEDRYRSVVESQTELICRYLPDATLTFVNAPYCRYFGKTQEELIGTKFLDLIPEPPREVVRKHIESLVENPRVEIEEHEVLLPNGDMGWQQWIDHAILDAGGKVVEFQAVGRDITERKQMEEELRDSEERLRLALEAGRMGVWEWDMETDALKWSKEHYTIMGLEPFSVGPKNYHTWADRVYPDDLPVTTRAIRRAIEEKGEYCCEYRVIWPDGSVRWVEGRGKPIYGEGGQCLKVNGLIVDISERKEAEEALRLSEDKFSKAFRSSPDAIAIGRQADGMVLEVNGRWEEILGYARHEAVGRTVRELQLYQNPGERARLISMVKEQGSARDFEVDIRIKSGEIRNALISAETIMIRDEPCLLLILQDITELKRAEEALRRNEEALRKSYARIEDLAGRLIASQEEERRHIARELHDDLNQQVAALAIGISRLKRQFPDAGAAVQEQIAKLRNKTDLLSERIRQVSHELHSSILQHVGLPAALNSYCAEFSDREGIAVALDVGDGVEGVSPETALCLYRVAQESLRNVARHSGARRAVVTLARVNGAVELRVVDQGVGFDPGQAHECRGLGLVSMEERVKLLHGSFVLTARPGAGTELRAQIPLRWGHEQTKSIVG
jgi:PAS domain S-box-containing protein